MSPYRSCDVGQVLLEWVNNEPRVQEVYDLADSGQVAVGGIVSVCVPSVNHLHLPPRVTLRTMKDTRVRVLDRRA